MSALHDFLRSTPDGARALAGATLRHDVLAALHGAVGATDGGAEEIARRLGLRPARVRKVLDGDGDVSVGLLAEYLHAAGFELSLQLVALRPAADAAGSMPATEEPRLQQGPGRRMMFDEQLQ